MIDIYAEDEALVSVASEISRVMDIKVYIDRTQEDRKITVDLKGVPLEKGVKMIAYPLNYVIFRDESGNAKELLIFKIPGLTNKQYRFFAGKGGREVGGIERLTGVSEKDVKKTVVTGLNLDKSSMSKKATDNEETKNSASASETRAPYSFQGSDRSTDGSDTVVLKGERGFEVGKWVAKRMQEAETLRAQKQIEANSREYAKREMEPLIDTVNLMAIQQNKNIPTSGAGVSTNGNNESNTSTVTTEVKTATSYQAPSSYNSWSANMQLRYYQFTSQSRSYNYYNYYQKMSSTINNSYMSYMRSYGK